MNSHINHNLAVTPDDRVVLGLYVYKPKRTGAVNYGDVAGDSVAGQIADVCL